MRNAAGREDEPAGTGSELLVADPEDVVALQHVKQLVLVFVDVQRCVDQRRHFLEEGERATGRLRREFHQDRQISEDEAFTTVRIERVAEPPFQNPLRIGSLGGACTSLRVREETTASRSSCAYVTTSMTIGVAGGGSSARS